MSRQLKIAMMVLGAFIFRPYMISAQLGGNNILELQLGNLPESEPENLFSVYDQFNLSYRFKGFRASVRTEAFYNQFGERTYISPTQYALTYQSRSLKFKAGHFYDMLGNGLLLRAYELPGTVYEDQGYRVRHGFYRDIEGVMGEYRNKVFHIKAMAGKPLINLIPPTEDRKERRKDRLEALETGIRIADQSLNFSWLRNRTDKAYMHFSSINFQGILPLGFSYNAELAKDLNRPVSDFGTGSRYAIFSSLTYSGLSLGVSLEWKNYQNFFLGSGFNDPPNLVREHTYKVLNRSTHVTHLSSETGFQLEVYYNFEGGQMITLNASRAVNEFSQRYVFSEYFGEFFTRLGDRSDLRLFLDYAIDEFAFEPRRYAGGSVFEHAFPGRWSANVEAEYQLINRDLLENETLHNGVLTAGVSKSSKFSASVVWELSTDPFLTDKTSTLEIERGTRHWIGTDLSYKLNRRHRLYLFAGQRRGGPACASGICYEVLDFTGIELRLKTRF